jgi:hypothetical protein
MVDLARFPPHLSFLMTLAGRRDYSASIMVIPARTEVMKESINGRKK